MVIVWALFMGPAEFLKLVNGDKHKIVYDDLHSRLRSAFVSRLVRLT